ncbi:hypothetical protein VMCG_09788 [Cytospora schulzeri]|uniref:6-phosphogluconolactonase n=1 Tax=Cytospora schulzeri TaxID=448051 RepID=A0A423VGU4_9PEZI|nr:hypothetical protein VMCG_09788 [Valsa malicola]
MSSDMRCSQQEAVVKKVTALGATAIAGNRSECAGDADVNKVLIGGGPSGTISVADFNGSSFNIVANNTVAGTSASWLLFKEPNLLYAVDENSNTTRLFNFDPDINELGLVQNATGSSGVVFLEFNKEKTVMVGAGYGEGTVDVWDVSARNGAMKLLKSITVGGTPGPVSGRQDSPHPHQALLDPSGRFFVVNDLGTDTILIIDSKADFDITNRITVKPAGNGPRHGTFYPPGAHKATHYFLASEIASLIKAFELTYTDNDKGLEFKEIQSISTFGDDFPPADPTTASAGELVISADGKHLYVSNRLTGNDTDSISHFSIDMGKDEPLDFVDQISSGGVQPRMFSLAADDSLLFSTNQDGDDGLLAFTRDAHTGSLAEKPVASVSLEVFGAPSFGPQYVKEVGTKRRKS